MLDSMLQQTVVLYSSQGSSLSQSSVLQSLHELYDIVAGTHNLYVFVCVCVRIFHIHIIYLF